MTDIALSVPCLCAGENNSAYLNITADLSELSGKTARLAFITPSGKHYLTPVLTFSGGSCAYPVPFTVLDRYGKLSVQLIITGNDSYCEKSDIFVFDVIPGIDENSAELDNGVLITLADVDTRLREAEGVIDSLTPISNAEIDQICV